MAWFRAAAAGAALLLWRRPWRSGLTRHDTFVAVQFGLVTIAMNVVFYEAISRIPLGTAVSIEFLGPIAVAAFSSRRATDLVAAALVGVGVVLLAGFEFDVDWAGFGFALASAAFWAGYILLGKRVADRGEGLDSLALGMAIGAAVLAPFILIPQAFIDSSVFLDSRTWVLGVAVGLLSTAVPYVLDQLVLTMVGRAKFALLLALLPATAAVIGATVLRQTPTPTELFGIGMVMLALLIGARPGAAPTAGAPSPPPA